MEINLKRLGEQAIESTTGGKKMKLSEDASSMVFQLFTKNVYSNPIGTVVREIASNCFDSHIEAKVNSPVIIRKTIDKQTDTIYISFIDFGVGMNPDRIYNIYGTYFESTKRMDNTQIGGFGIGGKTPLAYKRSTGMGEGEYDNSFYVITRFDGTEYVYCIYEGEESPIISELHHESTTERNGTEIRIPVLEKDIDTFQKEMLKQLYYFENIVFEGFEYEHDYNKDENGNPEIITPMSNDYQIIRGKSFLFRGNKYITTINSSNIHICLGRVAYPINYDILGLDSSDYRLPIALKIEIGDIGVTVSRESLDYSESTIKLLKNKLEAAKKEIVGLISKQYKNIKTLEEYFSVKNDFGKLEFKNGMTMNVGNLVSQKDVDFSNFKYSFMKMPNDKQLFKFFFETNTYGKKPSKSRYSNNTEFQGSYDILKSNNNILYIEDHFNRKIIKQAWLKDQYETYYIVRKRNVASRFRMAEIAELFNVSLDSMTDDKDNPVTFVQTLIDMQEEFMDIVRKNTENYNELEVPEDFIVNRKRGVGITPELRKITIPVKFVNGYSKDRIKLSSLFDYNMPIFYGTNDDESDLKNATRLFNILFNDEWMITHCDYQGKLIAGRYSDVKNKKSIMFIQIAKGNVKYMPMCKNAMHISMFKTKMLYRKEEMVRQYFQTHEMISKFNDLGEFYTEGYIDAVCDVWGAKVLEIKDYINTMSEKTKDNNLGYEKNSLKRHFDLSNIVKTKDQIMMSKNIDELVKLQKTNSKTLNYFNLPYSVERFDPEQIIILQLAMTL